MWFITLTVWSQVIWSKNSPNWHLNSPVVDLQQRQVRLSGDLFLLVLCWIRVLQQREEWLSVFFSRIKVLNRRRFATHTHTLTPMCWKSHERMTLVACLGRTPRLFLVELSSWLKRFRSWWNCSWSWTHRRQRHFNSWDSNRTTSERAMTKFYLRTTMKTSAAAGAEKQMIHIQNMIFLVWPSELQFNLKRILENSYRSLQSLMNLIEVSKIFQQHPDMSCVAQRELVWNDPKAKYCSKSL